MIKWLKVQLYKYVRSYVGLFFVEDEGGVVSIHASRKEAEYELAAIAENRRLYSGQSANYVITELVWHTVTMLHEPTNRTIGAGEPHGYGNFDNKALDESDLRFFKHRGYDCSKPPIGRKQP